VYDWSRAKNVMDEQTPLVANPYGMGGYTIAKIWQERLVNKFAEAASWDLTIVRPGFIWGPQHAEIAGMGRNFGRFFIMFGPRARIPLCHVVNCAHFLVEAVENPAAIGQTFNLVDEDDIRVWRYVREYTRRTGVRALLLPVPYLVGYRIAQLASFTSRVLFGNKGKLPSLLTPRRYESQFKPIRFSARKLQERMGWKPPLGFEQCLSQTYS
jgi:UDP-glucose 4-epimerase